MKTDVCILIGPMMLFFASVLLKCLLQYILILFANKGTEILATQILVTQVVACISEKIKSCNIT